MNSILREKVIKLRTEKNLSYSAIRKRLGVPKSTLSNWLSNYPLSEERIRELRLLGWEKGEASRERFREAMRKKKEEKYKEVYGEQKKRFEDLSQESFLIAGLMLYLGEGDKKNKNRINLANTDPLILKFFIKWLNDFLGIEKEKIRFQLHLYENMDIEKEKNFWIDKLEIKEKQIYKPSVRKLQKASFSYKESYRHGTCGIYVCDTEKKMELMAATDAFLDLYLK